ncbi:MAG: HAMP domain-containing protein, partial [Chitinophagaceae bacterium]
MLIQLLVGFSFLVNFPGYIADPLLALMEGIKAIANKQYNQQLKIYTDDELGELALAFNSMAIKLGEYESSNLAKVLSEKKRIETIIDNMSDVIIVLDAENKVLFINTVACSVLKLSTADVGKNVSELAKRNEWFRQVFEKEDNKEIGFKTETADRYFTRETIDVKNEEEAIGRIIILNNVTSFHELDAAKTNFIATISHELKTPIASMKLSLKLLEDERIGIVNEEQQSLIQNIKDDAGRLLRITGELLDLSQVESGNIHLEIAEVDPIRIVDYAKDAVQFQADDIGQHLVA